MGQPQTVPELVFQVLIYVQVALFVIGTIWFLSRSFHILIYSRKPALVVLELLMATLLSIFQMLGHAFPNLSPESYSCGSRVLLVALSFTGLQGILILRTGLLHFWDLLTKVSVNYHAQQKETVMVTKNQESGEAKRMESIRSIDNTIEITPFERWILKRKKWFTSSYGLWALLVIAVTSFGSLPVIVIVLMDNARYFSVQVRSFECDRAVGILHVSASTFMALMVMFASFMIQQVLRIKENFKILGELVLCSSIGGIAFTFDLLVGVRSLRHKEVDSFIILCSFVPCTYQVLVSAYRIIYFTYIIPSGKSTTTATSSPSQDGISSPSGGAPKASRPATMKEMTTQLLALLADPEGEELFEDNLKREFCIENLLFWKDVRAFEASATSGERTEEPEREKILYNEAIKIRDCFVLEDAPLTVNVSSSYRIQVLDHLQKYDAGKFDIHVFDDCKLEVTSLMVTNSFMRFRNSPEYQKWLEHKDHGIPTTRDKHFFAKDINFAAPWNRWSLNSRSLRRSVVSKLQIQKKFEFISAVLQAKKGKLMSEACVDYSVSLSVLNLYTFEIHQTDTSIWIL